MAETLSPGSFVLKQSTIFNRPFFFGTTAQTITLKASKNNNAVVTLGAVITEIDATNLPGWYNAALTVTDTSVPGIIAYHATASSGGPADFQDIVQPQILTDFAINASGFANISSNIKQNVALNGFPFVMRSSATGQPLASLTVTAQRSLGGGGYGACANAPTEIGGAGNGAGGYSINLASTDLNAATVLLLFTATGAVPLFIPLITQP